MSLKSKIKLGTLVFMIFGICFALFHNSNGMKSKFLAHAEASKMESVSITEFTQSDGASLFCISNDYEGKTRSDNVAVLEANDSVSVTISSTTTSYGTFSEAWSAVQAAEQRTAVITLLDSIEITEKLSKISNTMSNITLDLNGHMLTLNTAIQVSGGRFTLKDSSPTSTKNTIKKPGTSEDVLIEGGVLTCKNGQAITLDGGLFTLDGGTVAGCDVTESENVLGGGVYIGNIVWESGYVYSSGTFVMNNGAIKYNKAKYGGGVRIDDYAEFTMNGGEISHNVAEIDGGGLCVCNARTIELLQGKILYNNSIAGGGIYFEGKENSYSVENIEIKNNTAHKDETISYSGNGGGIYADHSAVVIGKSTISSNMAETNGGGVYVKQDSSFTVKDSPVILDNDSNNVYLQEGSQITLGELTSGAKIGVYNTGVIATYSNTFDISVFIPDQEGYVAFLDEGNKEVRINKAVAEVTIGENLPTLYVSFSEAWEAANANTLGEEAVVKLLDDIEIETTAIIKKGHIIKLDLNNHVLKYVGTNSNAHVLSIMNGTFTLEDTATNKTKREIVIPNKEETVVIEGGVITGGTGSGVDGYGTFSLNSGNIAGNMDNGVHLGSSNMDNFITINGGTIAGNGNSGVRAGDKCTFLMTDGLIQKNSSTSGGGVFLSSSGTFTMSGGTISNNTADYGGGVYNLSTSFQLSGGSISKNKASASGGGVYSSETLKVSGAPSILNNKVLIGDTEVLNNIYFWKDKFILIEGSLTKNGQKAQIGVSKTGKIAEGFNESYGKPTDYFISESDDSTYCAYLNGNVVEVKVHSGGTATCTEKAVCSNCGKEYGKALGHSLDGIGITKQPNKTTYSAFDTFEKEGMEVCTHCQRCNEYIDKISDVTISYQNNATYLSSSHVKVIISAMVNGKKYSTEQEVSVLPVATEVVWEYSLDGTNWSSIANDSSFIYDGVDKKLNVRAKFKASEKDLNSEIIEGYYYVRGTSEHFLVDESSTNAILNAKTYHLSLNNDSFGNYKFETNSADITIKPIEIDLSNDNNFYWILPEYNSALRDGYLDENYKYFSQNGAARTYYKRCIVRNRNEEVTIAIHGTRSVDVLGNDGLYTITDYTGNTGSLVGKYTAAATLTLKDKVNYKFIIKTSIDENRHMLVSINSDGSATISKDWYIAGIDNGLLSQNGDSYGLEWSFTGWTFGNYQTQYAPRLEHGDEGEYNGQYIFQENDNKVTFELYKSVLIEGKYSDVLIGTSFNRYAFGEYINDSIPAGSYKLKVIVEDYKTRGVHEHWWNEENHDATSDGLYFDGFTREFVFQVQNATLQFTNENEIKSKTFHYTYDGNLHLYESTFTPNVELLYVSAKDRNGIWKNEEYNSYYTAIEIKFNLIRWETNSYLSKLELEQIKTSKQSPREADTYIVKYKLFAQNYNEYGGENSFHVGIAKAQVETPEDQSYEYDGKAHGFIVDKDSLYTVISSAQTEVNPDGYDIILKIKDYVNYEWANGNETEIVKLKITPHIHQMTYYEAQFATCTESGVAEYWHCQRCNKDYKDANGTTEIALSELIIPALEHDLKQEEGKPATCTEKGWSPYETCSRCDYTTYAELPALGHDFGEWFVSKEATTEEYGEEKRICLHDDTHIETRTLPKRIAQLVEPDKEGGTLDEIILSIPNGFEHNIELVVKEISFEQNNTYTDIANHLNGEIVCIYDITLLFNGNEIQPEDTLTIRIRIPDSLKGIAFKVIHLHNQESIDMEYELDDNYVELKTDQLSEFVFIKLHTDKPNNTVWFICIILLTVIILGESGYIGYKKFYKDKKVVNK